MAWKTRRIKGHRKTPTFDTWHGTRYEFKEFDISKCEFGIHSGTEDQAKTCAGEENIPGWPIRRLIPLKVKLMNPLRLEDTGEWTAQSVWAQLIEKHIVSDTNRKTSDSLEILPNEEASAFVRSEIRKHGYDGIVYLNRREGINEDELQELQDALDRWGELTDNDVLNIAPSAQDSYIAFDKSQIKKRRL